MGRLLARIHTIQTSGYGTTFDWSQNVLSRNETWADFLRDEWEVEERMRVLDEQEMLRAGQSRSVRVCPSDFAVGCASGAQPL